MLTRDSSSWRGSSSSSSSSSSSVPSSLVCSPPTSRFVASNRLGRNNGGNIWDLLPSPYLLLAFLVFLLILFQFYNVINLSHRNDATQDPNAQKKSRLFFSINSGRVGTGYLAALLNTAKGVTGVHEPEPTMAGTYVKLINIAPLNVSFAERRIKADAIRTVLESLPRGQIYAESNSNFIRTFYDVILEEFTNAEIDVIIIRRYLPEVLKSLLELGHFGGNPATANWIPELTSPTRAFTSCKAPGEMDAYDYLITYLLDTEARANRFQKQFKDFPSIYSIAEVRQEELTTMEGVQLFFKKLRLESTSETETFIESQKVINRRAYVKNKYNVKTSVEQCLERIESYLEVCKSRDIPVPELPQLQRHPLKYDD
jgi:hypothetical protein